MCWKNEKVKCIIIIFKYYTVGQTNKIWDDRKIISCTTECQRRPLQGIQTYSIFLFKFLNSTKQEVV